MSDITTTHTARRDLLDAQSEPRLVQVPETLYLAVDGRGNAGSAVFQATLAALLRAGGAAGAAGPVEGLWWTGTENELDITDPDGWSWTLLLAVPEDAAAPGAGPVQLRRITEGYAVQVLHVGPYDAEGPTIDRLDAWIVGHGFARDGAHHELYLDDPRTTAPDQLRTILRQPVRVAA